MKFCRLLGRFLAVLALFSGPCVADDPRSAWAFYEIKLSELARIAFSQLLQVSFVADDAFISDQRKVSIDLKADKGGRARELLIALIRQYGYIVTEDAGLLMIRKQTEEDKGNGYSLYKPRFRSVSYLNDILGLQGARSIRTNDAQSQRSPQQENQGTPNALIDRATDVVYIKGADIERKRILAALQMIDVPHDQVELYAVIYEFQTTARDATAFGALLSIFKDRFSIGIGSTAGLDGATGQARIAAKSLQAVMSAISEDQRFRLISSPQLRVRSGATGRFSVGADVPTLGSTSTSSQGVSTQSVEYRKTGIQLEVTPAVWSQSIELDVRQVVSAAEQTRTGVNNSPTLLSRDLTTKLALQDGEVVLLGGLRSTRSGSGASGFSFLPAWARSRSDDSEATELLVILKATKLERPPILGPGEERAKDAQGGQNDGTNETRAGDRDPF